MRSIEACIRPFAALRTPSRSSTRRLSTSKRFLFRPESAMDWRFKEKKEAAEPEADPERDQRTVFAYQMPLKATERDVYEFFSKAGKLLVLTLHIHLIRVF
ncbi:uncharacterized protein LOC109820012 isoform X2 [Asparagus officinalis]|uniref:uncharacterized protein LOC109820012 isoform X2 n=1 Tax=Asparagus officinalis TaxID=4686 RepID=UPI00098E26B3|nr:uncharacterized protein LOC109820012 isoform X2 [Asparagus officinalis]